MQPEIWHRTVMHAVLIAVARVPLVAQSDDRPTLLEMARQGGGGAVIDTCGPLPSLADRVRLADLIVEGIVRTHPLDVFKVVNGAIVPPDEFSDVPKSVP
jgi:hypothetical protein